MKILKNEGDDEYDKQKVSYSLLYIIFKKKNYF